jgi:hypothetical protein
VRATDPIRVLVATGVSRDAIALALELMRPQLAVQQVEPAELEAAVLRERPDLVIAGEANEIVETRIANWVLLCPDGRNLGVVHSAGERRTIPAMRFKDLLAVVDAVVSAGRIDASPSLGDHTLTIGSGHDLAASLLSPGF